MAVSGLVFIGFVLVHMYGNLQAFAGHDAYNEYAHHIRTFGEPMLPYEGLLWVIRIVLIVSLVVHVGAAAALAQRNALVGAIRSGRAGRGSLAAWDAELARHGGLAGRRR